MLTEREREWLEDRKHKAYCRYCNVSKLCANPFASGYSCPLTGNMKDALEFSERVAAKLAMEHEKIMLNGGVCEACFAWETCFNGFDENDNAFCAFEMLKAARLEVEEEMDADLDK